MKRNTMLAAATLVAATWGCERSADRLTGASQLSAARSTEQSIGINVLLSGPVTDAQLAELGTYGRVSGRLVEINAVFLRASASQLPAIQALPYVLAAGPDAERQGSPVDAVAVADFAGGFNMWNLDAVNVTVAPLSQARGVLQDGNGVYVGVLDTGLLDSWRQYFPEQRIASQFAKAFSGGGQNQGAVSEPPNQWEHDQNSHGTHVTSTILGFRLSTPRITANINGVAPKVTVIPVKVLNQAGFGWSSVISHGIVYIANLKVGPLAAHPVVINMSLGGSRLDPVERAAIDFAIAQGVIIVAAAGNEDTTGMSFPGAYAPVISVAASGWVGEWTPHPIAGVAACNAVGNWWLCGDVAEPTSASDVYIPGFSSRERPGQDLDVAAPGSWVVGPFQLQSGKIDYFFSGGTSMASPHVAGIVALMAQKNPALTASQAEAILEATAIELPPGSRMIRNPNGSMVPVTWDASATGAGLATADAALAATTP